jgi:hypothetical protein
MYQVRIYHDGGTVKILGNGMEAPWAGGKYTPAGGDGEYVDEVIDLILSGTDADITAELGELGSFLYDAREEVHQVYLQIMTASSGAAWQSRIVAGWLEYYPQVGGTLRGNKSEKVSLHLRRRDEWEAYTETPVTMGNPRISPATQTAEILNCFDGTSGNYNYVLIDTGVIVGDLPGRCRVQVKNKDASYNLGALYVFLNTSGNYNPTLEAEAATSAYDTVTTCKDHCSGGYYSALAWSAAGEVTLLSWTVSTALLNALNGRPVRPMLRLHAVATITDMLLKIVVKSGSTVLYTGPWAEFVSGSEIQRLPSLQLPPGAMGHVSGYGALTMELVAWQPGAVAKVLDVDHLMIMPLDGERKLVDAAGLGTNESINDDSTLPGLWVLDGSGNKLGAVAGYGERLMLLPLVANILWFLQQDTNGVCRILHKCEVKVWYRPRRRIV